MSDTFQQVYYVETNGQFLGYPWSSAENWSSGIPTDGENVTYGTWYFNGRESPAVNGYDDIPSLSIPTLTLLESSSLGVEQTLSVGELSVAYESDIAVVSSAFNSNAAASVNLTIEAISGSGGSLDASGSGAVIDNLAPTDPGEHYYIQDGAELILAATPSTSSQFEYQAGGDTDELPATYAFLDPGSVINSQIANAVPGDVLEVPGSFVLGYSISQSNIYGVSDLDITTDAGSFDFTDFAPAEPSAPLEGYNATIDSTTGLLALTFSTTATSPNLEIWTNAVDGDWNTSDGWSNDSIPTGFSYGTTVEIGQQGNYTVSISPSDHANAASVLEAGGTLAVEGQFATLDFFDALTVGAPAIGQGTVVIGNGAAIDGPLATVADGSLIIMGGLLDTDPVTVDAEGNISGYGTVEGNETINGDVVAQDGTLDLTGNLGGSGHLMIAASAALAVEGTVAATLNLTFDAPGGALIIGANGDMLAPISGLATGDRIALEGQDVASVTFDSATNSLDIVGSTSGTYEVNLVGAYQQSNFMVADGEVLAGTPFCFLAGTSIATESDEIAVERLVPGTLVRTAAGALRPITWIGTGRVLATRGRRTAATPVIVRKGALADNVPHHDLHVTKAHSLFIDGALIPVEFLVNHRTILWDDRAQEVTIYHIELESHDVLLANGAPAESYRDDGNRWLFLNANSGWHLPPQPPCAPVLTGGPLVDAVWRRLLDRAGPRPRLPLSDDPDLHLSVDGRRVEAAARHGMAYIFGIADPQASVRIVSRSAVPAELGLARDPRCLGVALRRIVVRQGGRFRVTEAMDARLAQGFHAYEVDSRYRWTNGDATIPPELLDGFNGAMELVLHVGDTARYLDEGALVRAA